MKRFVVLDKKIGCTPLKAIADWRTLHPRNRTLPATYAGRLDPMASGKLLVLLGEECKRKHVYTGLDKEYRVNILLDISTDTGDTLGLPTYANQASAVTGNQIRDALRNEIGTRSHAYPAYSSKTVEGTPLFLHALRGTLHTITVPTHDETLYEIRLTGIHTLTRDAVLAYINLALSVVPRDTAASKESGMDFRQDAIREAWQTLFHSIPKRTFTVLSITVTAGSGAYMRTLAERIGRALGTCGMALSIHRTRIGTYRKLGSMGFFFPSY